MSSFRVTERSISSKVVGGLQASLTKLGTYQEQLSTGKQITRPSDNPGGTLSAMQLRTSSRTADQYSRNADDGIAWLGTIDSALSGAMDQVHRARDLVIQGMSAGASANADGREAIAVEVDNIRSSLISAANTKYLDRPVFGGNVAGTSAYDASGTYIGDDGAVTRTVGDNTKIKVNATGPESFGSGDTQIFDVLASISDKLRNDPASLNDDLARLDASSSVMQTKLSDVGARYGRVQSMKQVSEDHNLSLKTQLSDVEDIDLPKTITDMQLQQAAYQASLAAAAKVVQPSLVDFLR
ncbi:MAG: flagellar hook-associated protein 3 FlgL [Micromonosporaceae bacterium]|jgi:flagellar hook-associated protein 3 FlgL|nr:flagellar hook-associated protein 3 FlgL [Micromonosporaceae bacterium]